MSRVIRDFTTVLGLYRKGALLERLNEKLSDALEALAEYPDEKRKATLTLTLDITQVQERLELSATVKLKTPDEKGVGSALFFAAAGGLSLDHPSQLDMFPRDASGDRQSKGV